MKLQQGQTVYQNPQSLRGQPGSRPAESPTPTFGTPAFLGPLKLGPFEQGSTGLFDTPQTRALGPGDYLGRYRIESIIDSGAVARVFKAKHPLMEREVALKVLLTRHGGRDDLRRMMEREAKALSRIQHQNVASVYDADITDDSAWIAIEYVPGPTLRRYLRSQGPLPIERAIDIIRQVGAGLSAAHAGGVLHLDLKPENIIVNGDCVKVVDLGTAKLVRDADGWTDDTGYGVGTPEYMPPECWAQHGVPDARSDLYALALIFYELVTGRHPLINTKKRLTDEQIAWLHVRLAPKMPAELSFQIWEVVAAALEKDPARRPATVAEFVTALERASGSGGHCEASEPRARSSASSPVYYGLLFGAAVGCVGATGLWLTIHAPNAPGRSPTPAAPGEPAARAMFAQPTAAPPNAPTADPASAPLPLSSAQSLTSQRAAVDSSAGSGRRPKPSTPRRQSSDGPGRAARSEVRSLEVPSKLPF